MAAKKGQKSVVIIGAGVGGTATAARLAKAGFKVIVVEKNDFTGGRCSLIHKDGYRFDQGPSLLLLPRLFEETFRKLDTSLEAEGIELVKCEPNYNIWFGDGQSFELSTDLARMKLEIEKWEGKAGYERYLSFLQESHRHYELSVTHVLKKNFTSLLSMARPSFLRHLLALHPFESIYSRAAKYFWTERLRRVFTFGSMYMGMSPFDAPGTYSLLQYTELAEGIWYPIGGFHRVVEGLVTIGKRLGVTYRLGTSVASITTSPDGRTATGVLLDDGTSISADIVINNSDLVYAYNNLLPASSHAKSLSKREGSCSSISFYWGLNTQIPQLKAHNIFLADDYRQSFDSIFKDQLIPREPSFYVNVPSRIDPSAAPPNCDTLVILVPVGHLINSDTDTAHASSSSPSSTKSDTKITQDWPTLVSRARQQVLTTISTRLNVPLSTLQNSISSETLNTPPTWKTAFNLDKGSILGLSHSFFNVLSFRPRTKHSSLKNLYFVGASTHPGTGVPIVLAGAKIVAGQVMSDAGMHEELYAEELKEEVASKKRGPRRRTDLDEVRSGPLLSTIHWVLVAILGMLLAIWRSLPSTDVGQMKVVGDW